MVAPALRAANSTVEGLMDAHDWAGTTAISIGKTIIKQAREAKRDGGVGEH